MAKKTGKKAGKKASKKMFKIPRTAAQARKMGSETSAKHGHDDRQRWVMVKHRNWSFERAGAAIASKPQTICHYDPNTGTWTDCSNIA